MITGGPNHYEGERLDEVHRGLNISVYMFEVFMNMLEKAFREVGLPEEEFEPVREVLVNLKSSILID